MRNLSDAEITQLEKRGCTAVNWNQIQVSDTFDANKFRNVMFSGDITLGNFTKRIKLPGGIERECGIYESQIHQCTFKDNVFVSNVKSMANYHIQEDVIIHNVGSLLVEGKTSFGNGTEIDVFNEAGGRSLKIFDRLSAQLAYFLVFYRHNPKLITNLEKMIDQYVETKTKDMGTIGRGTRIINANKIVNTDIGEHAQIVDINCLEEGTIQSNMDAPVTISSGVLAKKFIILSGSKVTDSAIVDKSFIGQSVKLGKQYSAENSVFFCNSEMFHGEGCSVFAGPYTVTHHKSTLLIAGFFSFYNAGSATNQSNHMYKLGPVHQGILERGSKTGSFSYLLWPSRVGPFTNVIGKHYSNFNTSDLPFSLINESDGRSVCVPGMNMFTVGTKRDSLKWPARDGRKDPVKLDLIHFHLWSPYIIGKMLRGLEKLKTLSENARQGQDYLNFNGISIQRLMVKISSKYYEMGIKIFIGNCLIKKLETLSGTSSLKTIQDALAKNKAQQLSKWLDINGLLAQEEVVQTLIDQISTGKIKHLEDVNERFTEIYHQYEEVEWPWCAKLIEEKKGIALQNITVDDMKTIIDEWQTSLIKFNNMIVQDAMKEFDAATKTSFGIDGDESIKEADFAAVRGTLEENSFVKSVKEEIVKTESQAKKLIEYIEKLK